jgi:hypothetical protein
MNLETAPITPAKKKNGNPIEVDEVFNRSYKQKAIKALQIRAIELREEIQAYNETCSFDIELTDYCTITV